MTKQELQERFVEVEALARTSRLSRFLAKPLRYLETQYFNKWVYPKTKQSKRVEAETFYGQPLQIDLPAATDIYLTGGKTHDSELRLTRFLIESLEPGDEFLDIGAHVGFFSLLAAQLVGEQGRVYSIEAAPKTFALLELNSSGLPQLERYQAAASDRRERLCFYQFPSLYSEYNAMDISAYQKEPWFAKYPPTKVEVEAWPLDELLPEGAAPKIIKIDVEGAEYKALQGMQKLLKRYPKSLLVMEYLPGTEEHKQARYFLEQQGYSLHSIDEEGRIRPLQNIEAMMHQRGLDSENVLFLRRSV